MGIPLIDLKAQYATIKSDVDSAVHRVLDNATFILGEEVATFEKAFAAFQQVEHAIGVSSGTDAITLCLHAIGIEEGDEIITTPFTFIATAEPMLYFGARPVFVDIEPETMNLDPALIEAAITDQTKAIMPVHLFGHPANMEAIMEIAERHNLYVIEDAAQAHGAEISGKRIGNFGHLSTFSFYPSKNLGCMGDGGAIVTNDDTLAQKIRMLRNHGRTKKYEHEIIGYGARLDAMQAAILGAKLPHLEDWTEARIRLARYYTEQLQAIDWIEAPRIQEDFRHVFHLYVINVKDGRQDELVQHLKTNQIGTGIYYPLPNHLQPALDMLGYKEGDFPVTEQMAQECIALPLYPELTHEHQDQVIQILKAL